MLFLTLICIFLCAAAGSSSDYYELLGISKDADNREIRKAFKKLALKFHPDKNKDKDSQDKFISINKAYEVLKDEETRKKYDLYGEDGLKEDFGQSWKGNYRSWNYYYESFGIYDDDPEIITFSRNDFHQSVLDSSDIWFINFYSPQCSHCHHLAPAWRELARELKGVIRIGAVNCEEDWGLCRARNIYSYPSLMFYPNDEKYHGSKETEAMIEYVLQKLPNHVIKLTSSNFLKKTTATENSKKPWLIFVCKGFDCVNKEDLKKLGIMLANLVNVAEVNPKADENICSLLNCEASVTYYKSLNLPVAEQRSQVLEETEIQDISKKVLELLPEATVLSDTEFEEIRSNLKKKDSTPWLICFTNSKGDFSENNLDLKRLGGFLSDVNVGQLDCFNFQSVCSSLYVKKYPAYILFKSDDSYEYHYGRLTVYDVAKFAREALSSQVHTLTPQHFPNIVDSDETWFIDFFAPWCPPCMQLLPEWRKASYSSGHFVKFGTVDCTTHEVLCRQYKINSFPTTVLYNRSVPHQFRGAHSRKKIEEFIQDILHPSVISLTPASFERNMKENTDDAWVIDFYAPWCGPCQQLAPEWRKLAKRLSKRTSIHVADIDCQAHRTFCVSVGVNSYPTIRFYPVGRGSENKFFLYNGWNRDADSLQGWIFQYLPSNVVSLNEKEFDRVLLDTKPWLIDFYAPWCGHCNIFAPKFEEVSTVLKGKVKTGKINCDEQRNACNRASVRAYPTVLLYRGKASHRSQNPYEGIELVNLTPQEIISFLERTLQLNIAEKRLKDEL
ncbi:dnaJ homolog subfamily C member 10-like [Uloborus diversus]|uniref:dnaJ homolog subfamily C member 10-like n=1 Tax=Uloborus diversus TaxID=327109 RepID=UPI00240A1B7F|nr:dnaJ homolog subfamily C member 10-like [Uloborus diversus]